MKQPTFDKDGYPTEETLRIIREWKIESKKNTVRLLTFCVNAWNWKPYGITAKDSGYEFHVGGWSGNEDIISAMQDNRLFWSLCWQASRRGGHYKFDLTGVPECITNQLT